MKEFLDGNLDAYPSTAHEWYEEELEEGGHQVEDELAYEDCCDLDFLNRRLAV